MTLAFAPERIEHWPLARLQPYAKNAKMHGPDQVLRLAASMAEFGWTVPCLVAEDGELIAGHGRVLAATDERQPTWLTVPAKLVVAHHSANGAASSTNWLRVATGGGRTRFAPRWLHSSRCRPGAPPTSLRWSRVSRRPAAS